MGGNYIFIIRIGHSSVSKIPFYITFGVYSVIIGYLFSNTIYKCINSIFSCFSKFKGGKSKMKVKPLKKGGAGTLELSDNRTYYHKARLNFENDYDIANPYTHRKAFNEWLEVIRKHDNDKYQA